MTDRIEDKKSGQGSKEDRIMEAGRKRGELYAKATIHYLRYVEILREVNRRYGEKHVATFDFNIREDNPVDPDKPKISGDMVNPQPQMKPAPRR